MPVTQAKPVFADVPAWPEGKPAPAGHNRPPLDVVVVEEFNDAVEGHDERAQQLLDARDRVSVTDAESAGRVGTYVAQVNALLKAGDDKRKAVKQPYLDATRALDARYKAWAAPLEDVKASASDKLDQFMREERAREAAERRRQQEAERAAEVERQRLIAEARKAEEAGKPSPAAEFLADAGRVEAPPPPPSPTPIRSDYGTLVSTRTTAKATVTDYTLAFMAVEKNEKVRDAIDKAVQALVRSGQREIPGVTVTDEIKASVR